MNLAACLIPGMLSVLLPQGEGDKPVQKPARPRIKPMPIPGTVIVKLQEGKRIVVDGSLSEWPEDVEEGPVNLVDTRQVSGTWMGSYNQKLLHKDISGKVFLLWDEERLYVGAKVWDDWHRAMGKQRQRANEIPPADSLMLSIDPDRDTRSLGPDDGRREDREFWLADVEGQGRRLVLWDRYRGTARHADGAVLVITRANEIGITTYEAAIPWNEILPRGRKPKVGLDFDLQVVLNDFDEPTDPMPQTRVGWTFGMGPEIDPGIFGTVMLVEQFDRTQPPRIPKVKPLSGDPVPGPGYWVRFLERLRKQQPARVEAATVDAAMAGGMERFKLLQELEHHLSVFPRVDFLEFQQRVHRRMAREAAGIAKTGVPFFWHHALKDVRRRIPALPAAGYIRVFRLPQGGWFIRSPGANFVIDPAGYELAPLIGPGIDFVLLTRPLDQTKRNDRLLVELARRKKVIFSHLLYHLPGVDAAKMSLAVPGNHYRFGDVPLRGGKNQKQPKTVPVVTIHVVGHKTKEGLAPPSVGYELKWYDGTRLLHAGVSLDPTAARSLKGPDVLLLSALHPQAAALGKQVAAKLTILDEVLEVPTAPGPRSRVTLTEAIKLQQDLRPLRSTLLAPGESVDVKRPRRTPK